MTGQVKSIKYDLFSQFESNNFEIFNRQLSSFSENDKKGIRFLKSQRWNCMVKGVEFSNGTIELDIRGKDLFQQSFVGIAFHGVDNETYDGIYFRPFNFSQLIPFVKFMLFSIYPILTIHGIS